ncbi:hypothetical protein NKH48_36235, partial [Mesorhizobium sp. M1233]|uniref:hypothetical protein n=1 Tax=Mesorhizobium sp. M1233 TaxID=2957072 RepID=UPI003339D023
SQGVHLFWWTPHASEHSTAKGAGKFALTANFPNLSFVMPNLRRVDTIQRDLNQRSIKAKQIREEYLGRLQAEGFEIDEAADLLSLEDPDE